MNLPAASGPLRLLFAGSPAIALPSLAVIAEGCLSRDRAPRWTLAGVLTNPDKPRGRSGVCEATEVAAASERYRAAFAEAGLRSFAVLKPETLGEQAREETAALRPDLLVCFAYGRIFGPKFMSLFPLGGINIHPSLLPKYRGASPIQEAVLNGDGFTGVSIQMIAPEMDTGNLLAQKTIALDGRETTESLSIRAAETAAALLGETLDRIAKAGNAGAGTPQEGEASYCSRIEKKSGVIDWNQGAGVIDRRIRAFTPWPLARTGHNGQILYILEAAPFAGQTAGNGALPGQVLGTDKKNGILIQTGDGILAVSRLQYQARKALSWEAFLNGARDFTGSRLVSEDC
jgi:methionyl-tRNA formyltransferase